MEQIITKITYLFEQDASIKIIKPFNYDNKYWIVGSIIIKYKGAELRFKVEIPRTYPITQPHVDNISINFINIELYGLKHINPNGSVCYHPQKEDNFDRKFLSEIKGLKKWIRDYYIHDKEDEQYSYLLYPNKSNDDTTLFFGETEKKFQKGEFGEFLYAPFINQKQEISKGVFGITKTLFRLSIEKNYSEKWSNTFTKLFSGTEKRGLWYYIQKEPLKNLPKKRIIVEYWDELQLYLSQPFIKNLYDILRKGKSNYYYDNELYLLLGYKIPTKENYENHWQLIKIPKRERLITTEKVEKDKYKGVLMNKEILWSKTVNAQYDRFFGRGKLHSKLTESRLLIIGIGALGSSLAEILVRGGAKDIFLDDFDYVKAGNLCRANYTLLDLNFSKIDRLANRLKSISPFVDVYTDPLKLSRVSKQELEVFLNKNCDIIFDCSADSEITYLLDKINFKGEIISLGLTNKAEHLCCITGQGLTTQSASFFTYLDSEPPTFFEGAGCGYATFEANYNDINLLLNAALKKLNQDFHNDKLPTTFIIKNMTEYNQQINIKTYYKYSQKELNQYIYIPQTIINKVREAVIPHSPNEFGGILTGTPLVDFNTIIVDDILLPSEYESKESSFIRYPEELNKKLKDIFEDTNGKIVYIGEFHSHPNSSTQPSEIDKNAMKEIAENPLVKINSPILMITNAETNKFEADIYIYKNNKFYLYEQCS